MVQIFLKPLGHLGFWLEITLFVLPLTHVMLTSFEGFGVGVGERFDAAVGVAAEEGVGVG